MQKILLFVFTVIGPQLLRADILEDIVDAVEKREAQISTALGLVI